MSREFDLTQKEMAEKLFMSINTYTSYENNLRKTPVEVFIKVLEMSGTENDKKQIECLKNIYNIGD